MKTFLNEGEKTKSKVTWASDGLYSHVFTCQEERYRVLLHGCQRWELELVSNSAQDLWLYIQIWPFHTAAKNKDRINKTNTTWIQSISDEKHAGNWKF